MENDNNYYIRQIMSKSVDIHNRCNEAIGEILRNRDAHEVTVKLTDSIQYMIEDMLRIISK